MSSFLFWLKLFMGLTVAVGAIFLIAFNEQEIGNFLAETKGSFQGFFKNSSQELAASPEITEYFEEETETEEEPLETENINISQSPKQPSLEEIQEELDDISEKTDILAQEVEDLEQETINKGR